MGTRNSEQFEHRTGGGKGQAPQEDGGRGSDLCVKLPRAREGGRPGCSHGPCCCCVHAQTVASCPQPPADMSLARGGAERLGLPAGGGGAGSWVVCVPEEAPRAYLVINAQ